MAFADSSARAAQTMAAASAQGARLPVWMALTMALCVSIMVYTTQARERFVVQQGAVHEGAASASADVVAVALDRLATACDACLNQGASVPAAVELHAQLAGVTRAIEDVYMQGAPIKVALGVALLGASAWA